MVSTRRNSGSFSNANKRPSSSEDKTPSPSPKRQKVLPFCLPFLSIIPISRSIHPSDSLRYAFSGRQCCCRLGETDAAGGKFQGFGHDGASRWSRRMRIWRRSDRRRRQSRWQGRPHAADRWWFIFAANTFFIFRLLFFFLIFIVLLREGSTPTVVADKPRGSFSSWAIFQKQNPNFEASVPWCRLLSQSAQVNF